MTQRLADLTAQLPDYDPKDLPVAQAHRLLLALVEPLAQQETVPLFEALGRVLAQDIIAPFNVPPHDNSAMDGYAFDGAALQDGGPLQQTPVGTVLAGQQWQGTLAGGQCLRIMTGAVLPNGLDTVVPQELTQTLANGRIQVDAARLRPGANRRLAGEDLRQGSVALPAGERLGPIARLRAGPRCPGTGLRQPDGGWRRGAVARRQPGCGHWPASG